MSNGTNGFASTPISIFGLGEMPVFKAPSKDEEIAILRSKVQQLTQAIRSLDDQPCLIAHIVDFKEKHGQRIACFTVGNGQVFEKPLPDWAVDAKLGMCVRCLQQNLTPIEFIDTPPARGVIITVDKVHTAMKLIEYAGGSVVPCGFEAKPGDRVLLNPSGEVAVKNLGPNGAARGQIVNVLKVYEGGSVIEHQGTGVTQTATCDLPVKEGDRVILNVAGNLVLENLGAGGNSKTNTKETGVTWDDVGGLVDAKRDLREAIEEPVLKRDLYRLLKKKACKGIGLFGPPGTGKTMLAKAAASALATVYGKSAQETGFIYVKGPELLNGLVGSSESAVRGLFASARAHAEKNGYPAIIFLDEADALLSKRGMSLWAGMEKTIVPQFLSEMDGLDETGAIVLFATNRVDQIDPAFLRKGRIDLKIEIGRPAEKDCADIFAKALRGVPCSAPGEDLGVAAAEELFRDRHVLRVVNGKDGLIGRERITLGNEATGALVAGIVEMAKQRAIRFAETHPEERPEVRLVDLVGAVADVLKEEIAISKGHG